MLLFEYFVISDSVRYNRFHNSWTPKLWAESKHGTVLFMLDDII